jgi:hypothetical protein
MRNQVEAWQRSELTDVTAKVVIYEAFVEGKLEAPKHLARMVRDLYLSRSTRSSGREPLGVSETRSRPHSRNSIRSPIQGDGEAARVPGGSVLAVVLRKNGGARRPPMVRFGRADLIDFVIDATENDPSHNPTR